MAVIDEAPRDTGTIPRPRAARQPRRSSAHSTRRSLAIALVSTAAVFGLLALVVVNSPGWDSVRESFLDGENFAESAPRIVARFEVNVRLFVIAEILILAWGLVLAILRGLPGPVLFPVRLLATAYVDLWLVHWPPNGAATPSTWRALRDLRDQGLVRAIGVSNYSLAQIDQLVDATDEAPAINQIPWSPADHDPMVLSGHAQRGVAVQGYSPLKRTEDRKSVV